jgi:hypothetical protein
MLIKWAHVFVFPKHQTLFTTCGKNDRHIHLKYATLTEIDFFHADKYPAIVAQMQID